MSCASRVKEALPSRLETPQNGVRMQSFFSIDLFLTFFEIEWFLVLSGVAKNWLIVVLGLCLRFADTWEWIVVVLDITLELCDATRQRKNARE